VTKPTSTSGSDGQARLAVTVGEPAGIGPDLCLGLAAGGHAADLLFIGDPEQLRRRASRLSLDVQITTSDRAAPGEMRVAPIQFPNPDVCGTPDPANAEALLDGLRHAVDGCRDGRYAAMVTAPMQKSVVNDAGIAFTGHTEYLAELCGGAIPVMLLVADQLRVALVTTHMPLRAVPDAITDARIRDVVSILNNGLVTQFRLARPAIIVCGLNPHAGESGHLGTEDRDIIAPAVAALREAGIDVRGPLPADTAFTPAAGHADAVVAMYHDQGLPVLKYAGFGHAVNVTLGLPIIRTSVDHGTALDIAGLGRADAGSLRAAIDLARFLSGQ